MHNAERVSIPLLAELIPDGIGHGTSLLVEYDPHSQWFALGTTIVAHWLQVGNRALCPALGRPREVVVNALERLGINVTAEEEVGKLRVDDWYSASLTLGQSTSLTEAIDGKYVKIGSVKVADLSVAFLKQLRGHRPLDKWSSEEQIGVLAVVDSFSMLLRFNEEKTFLEWFEGRDLPLQRKLGRINLWGFGRGLHSEQFYRRLENMSDGLVEVRVMEREDGVKNLVRVTGLKGQPHDTRWHEIEVKSNGEAIVKT